MIHGKVVSGFQEGQTYVPRYNTHFETMLGFTCFLGTLNLKVNVPLLFDESKKITITPEEGMAVDCYLIKINDEHDGAIVIPHHTKHEKNIIEIISPVNLREELHLENGDEIRCELV